MNFVYASTGLADIFLQQPNLTSFRNCSMCVDSYLRRDWILDQRLSYRYYKIYYIHVSDNRLFRTHIHGDGKVRVWLGYILFFLRTWKQILAFVIFEFEVFLTLPSVEFMIQNLF